jgi:hypothetical protein
MSAPRTSRWSEGKEPSGRVRDERGEMVADEGAGFWEERSQQLAERQRQQRPDGNRHPGTHSLPMEPEHTENHDGAVDEVVGEQAHELVEDGDVAGQAVDGGLEIGDEHERDNASCWSWFRRPTARSAGTTPPERRGGDRLRPRASDGGWQSRHALEDAGGELCSQ